MGFNPVRNDAQGDAHRLEVDVASTTSVRDLNNTLTKMAGHEMDDMELRYYGETLHPDQALKDCTSRAQWRDIIQLTKKDPTSDGHVKDTVHILQPPKDQQVGLIHIQQCSSPLITRSHRDLLFEPCVRSQSFVHSQIPNTK